LELYGLKAEERMETRLRIDHLTISERAYQLWESRGRPEGSAVRDWLDAERQLSADDTSQSNTSQVDAANREASKTVDEALKDTFPASDAPGSHLPDVPPANADAKWEAAGVERAGVERKMQSRPSTANAPKAAITPAKDSSRSPDR